MEPSSTPTAANASSATSAGPDSLEALLKHLIPSTPPQSKGDGDIATQHLDIVIFGNPNTGKTTLATDIATIIKSLWPDKVMVLRTSRNLPGIFQAISHFYPTLSMAKGAVLIADDMTKALDKLKGSVIDPATGDTMSAKAYWLDKWYDIRGELARHGMVQGLAVKIMTTHRFYGAPLDMRHDPDLMLCRSTGARGTFDARFIQRLLGDEVYKGLRKHEEAALNDPSEKGWTAYATKTDSGLIYVPVSNVLPIPAIVFASPVSTGGVSWWRQKKWRVPTWVPLAWYCLIMGAFSIAVLWLIRLAVSG